MPKHGSAPSARAHPAGSPPRHHSRERPRPTVPSEISAAASTATKPSSSTGVPPAARPVAGEMGDNAPLPSRRAHRICRRAPAQRARESRPRAHCPARTGPPPASPASGRSRTCPSAKSQAEPSPAAHRPQGPAGRPRCHARRQRRSRPPLPPIPRHLPLARWAKAGPATPKTTGRQGNRVAACQNSSAISVHSNVVYEAVLRQG